MNSTGELTYWNRDKMTVDLQTTFWIACSWTKCLYVDPRFKVTLFSPSAPKIVHDDVIKWKHFPRYWPYVRGIHRSRVNSPQKGQWRGALMSSLICVWINGWVNNREAGDLRRYRAHYDVTVMRNYDTSVWFLVCLRRARSTFTSSGWRHIYI